MFYLDIKIYAELPLLSHFIPWFWSYVEKQQFLKKLRSVVFSS